MSAGDRFTVTTSAGRIRAHRLVNAAGAWANDLAALTGLELPLWSDGLHLNVTEPREHVLGPMVQHIGRRLTLKQTTQRHLHHRRRLAGPPRAATAALLDTLGQHGGQRRSGGSGRAAARRRPHRPDVVGRDGIHQRSRAHRRRVPAASRLPRLIATTGFTLSPLMGRLLAETMATGHNLIPRNSPSTVASPRPIQPEEAER